MFNEFQYYKFRFDILIHLLDLVKQETLHLVLMSSNYHQCMRSYIEGSLDLMECLLILYMWLGHINKLLFS
jgi:hypothetical protein